MLTGETIIEYLEDRSFPSKLLIGFCDNRPIHVVCSYNPVEKTTIVITAYEPSLELWENDFKTRKK